jgi:hypothetical protein
MTPDTRQVAELTGRCAVIAGLWDGAAPPCAWPADSAPAAVWRRGFAEQAGVEARELGVSRETSDETVAVATGRCGRGRSRLGPRREWLAAEQLLAAACAPVLGAAEIGRLIGRSAQAVRNQIHRLRRATCSQDPRRSNLGTSA